jgi:hypothetical protein
MQLIGGIFGDFLKEEQMESVWYDLRLVLTKKLTFETVFLCGLVNQNWNWKRLLDDLGPDEPQALITERKDESSSGPKEIDQNLKHSLNKVLEKLPSALLCIAGNKESKSTQSTRSFGSTRYEPIVTSLQLSPLYEKARESHGG